MTQTISTLSVFSIFGLQASIQAAIADNQLPNVSWTLESVLDLVVFETDFHFDVAIFDPLGGHATLAFLVFVDSSSGAKHLQDYSVVLDQDNSGTPKNKI